MHIYINPLHLAMYTPGANTYTLHSRIPAHLCKHMCTNILQSAIPEVWSLLPRSWPSLWPPRPGPLLRVPLFLCQAERTRLCCRQRTRRPRRHCPGPRRYPPPLRLLHLNTVIIYSLVPIVLIFRPPKFLSVW